MPSRLTCPPCAAIPATPSDASLPSNVPPITSNVRTRTSAPPTSPPELSVASTSSNVSTPFALSAETPATPAEKLAVSRTRVSDVVMKSSRRMPPVTVPRLLPTVRSASTGDSPVSQSAPTPSNEPFPMNVLVDTLTLSAAASTPPAPASAWLERKVLDVIVSEPRLSGMSSAARPPVFSAKVTSSKVRSTPTANNADAPTSAVFTSKVAAVMSASIAGVGSESITRTGAPTVCARATPPPVQCSSLSCTSTSAPSDGLSLTRFRITIGCTHTVEGAPSAASA